MDKSRNELREKTLDAIYSCLIQEKAKIDYDPGEVFCGIFKIKDFSEADIYAREVFVDALKHKDEIIALVQPHLVKWKFDRLNEIAQAIFLLSVSEASYAKVTPKPVAIYCAVDLAKRYLDAQDYKYINAVLDKVL
jgi:transcription antitermination factor NusB